MLGGSPKSRAVPNVPPITGGSRDAGGGTTAPGGSPVSPRSLRCPGGGVPASPPHRSRCWRMRGTMAAGGAALPRKGCRSSSGAVALCPGSRTSIRSRKPLREGDTWGGRGGQRRPRGVPRGPRAPPASSYLVGVFQLGGQVVADHFHGFEGGLVEIRGFPVHHLDHHHPQRPDVNLGGQNGALRGVGGTCAPKPALGDPGRGPKPTRVPPNLCQGTPDVAPNPHARP